VSRGQRTTSFKAGIKYAPRQRPLTEAQISEIWARRAAEETGTRIARHMGRYGGSIRKCIYKAGGIRPRPRERSRIALSLEEQEEILAVWLSLRSIAARIWQSAVDRLTRGGPESGPSELSRWQRRPGCAESKQTTKAAKLRIGEALRLEVIARLEDDWSPQQISRF
jgi:hypothetical protein